MILASELYDFVDYVANQYQTGRISPEEFNLSWKNAEIEYINEVMGRGKNAVDSMGATDAANDILRVFKATSVFSSNNWGEANLPEDYWRYVSLTMVEGIKTGRPVSLISPDQWGARASSQLNPVSKYPIAKLIGSKVNVLPVNTRYELTYLRTPVTPSWGYTLDAFTRPVFDAATSVDSELPAYMINEIAFKICSYLGINLSKVELIQYAEAKTQ